jgi:hypothetical protein
MRELIRVIRNLPVAFEAVYQRMTNGFGQAYADMTGKERDDSGMDHRMRRQTPNPELLTGFSVMVLDNGEEIPLTCIVGPTMADQHPKEHRSKA